MATLRTPPAQQHERHHRRTAVFLAVVLALASGGILAWHRRSIQITLNGADATTRNASSLEQVAQSEGITVVPGNYVSVAGNVISQGGGYALSAMVNGQELEGDAATSYRVRSGDDIRFEDGTDKMEPYDTTVEDIQPYLRMDGNVGAVNYVSQWGKTGSKEVRHGRDSGEAADGDTIQAAQDCVITVKDVQPDDGKKVVALTFDDGPAEQYTKAYLDILGQYDAKATFFELGKNVQEYPDLAKAVLSSGNEIMSHTQSHKQLTELDQDTLMEEIGDSFDAIRAATGLVTTAIRPPYGAFREGTWLKTGGRVSLRVNWDKDSEDWQRPGVDKIVSNATDGIQPGDIILMHDGGGDRDQDVEALPIILKKLRDQGYTVTTVSDLLKSDSSIPQDIASGTAAMPSDAVWPSEISPDDLSVS